MGLSTQQVMEAASAITEAIRSGSPLPETEADQLIAAVGEELSDSEIGSLIYIFRPVIRGSDWPSYLSQEGLPLHGLTSEERDAIEFSRSRISNNGSDDDNDPVDQEIRQRQAENRKWEAAESPLLERLEMYLGADAQAVKRIAETIEPVTDAFLTLPKLPGEQLPERLRAALPITVLPVTDRHESCKFMHSVLRAIGLKGRGLPQVIRLCGRELALLFPDEVDPRAGTYKFRQARYLIEGFFTSSPNDVEAVAWLAELSLRAGDQDTAAIFAKRLWSLSERCPPSDLARLIQFSLSHDWDYREPIFDGTNENQGLLGRLKSEWFDRDEPLAHAMLRRAFSGDKWNADLVQTVVELCVGWSAENLSDDIMPADGWVWAAHSFGQAGMGYHSAWERAYSAARAQDDGAGVILAVPFLIALALRRRTDPRYVKWLEALLSSANTPGLRRSAANVVAGVALFKDYLPISAKVLVERLSREFAAEMQTPSEEVIQEAHTLSEGLLDVDAQEPQALHYLGKGVWEHLSSRTRGMILEAIGVYRSFQQKPGEGGEYGLVFIQLANVIVYEVDVQLSLVLRRRWSVFDDRDYHCILGEKYQRGLGSLPYLFSLLHYGKDKSISRDSTTLKAKGIRLDMLVRLRGDIEELARVRNQSAHAGERIDRERAAVLFGKWFEKRKLKELFEAIMPNA